MLAGLQELRGALGRASGLAVWLPLALAGVPMNAHADATAEPANTSTEPANASTEPSPGAPWPPALRLYGEWGNDQLYGSEGDDKGFTQELTLRVHAIVPANDLWLGARQRLMIERGGERRTDELTFELGWLTERGAAPFVWTFGPVLSLVLSGNYGGSKLQNTWHELVDNGYTFDAGLANAYAPHRTGVVLGGRGGPSWLPLPWLRLLVGVELAGAVGGTGRSIVAVYDALELESGSSGFRLVLTGGVDYERNWTRDPTLRLDGGYDTTGIYRSAHVRLAARGRSWEAGYQARTNVGGSAGHQGMVYVLLGGGEGFRHAHALR